jgi:DNA polymerase V
MAAMMGRQLIDEGVRTVFDLAKLDPATVRRRWSVVLERTVRELQGQPCIDLEDAPPAKKEIACTRSFGHAVTDLGELEEAVTTFASRAAEKLRRQDSQAGQVITFVRTSPFRPDKQFSKSILVPLRRPTADTAALVEAALIGLRAIYRPGYKLAKAGVMLVDLTDSAIVQGELDLVTADVPDRSKLMTAMDELNLRYGRGAVILASAGTGAMPKATLNKPSKISAQTWMTQFFGLLCLSRGPFGQFAGR